MASRYMRSLYLKPVITTKIISQFYLPRYRCYSVHHRTVETIFKPSVQALDKIAIQTKKSSYSYKQILHKSQRLCQQLKDTGIKQHECVTFVCPNDANYPVCLWASWLAGLIAVPLHKNYPVQQLKYYVTDSRSRVFITTPELQAKVQPMIDELGMKLVTVEQNQSEKCSDDILNGVPSRIRADQNAMLIYTSGTTGMPKGVCLTHENLVSQSGCLIDAWRWSSEDSILHTLPLHHVHGIVNALICPLRVGARVVMHESFDAESVWHDLVEGNISVYMGVPTMYAKLITKYWKVYKDTPNTREYIRARCKQKIRLMVSGSASLPVPVFKEWEEITGHSLLERYGMTEIGMALSNPLHPATERIPGTVGRPLPGVSTRIVEFDIKGKSYKTLAEGNEKGSKVLDGSTGPISGELLVKGKNVFKEYWQKPEATEKEFTQDGWFRTGDTVEMKDGVYSILGRTSVDIIKTGGYKVSALQVETQLLTHPLITEVTVLGLPDHTWGQKIAAVVQLKENSSLTLKELREWGKDFMAPHTVPSILHVISSIPRNPMGKVNKKELLKKVFPDASNVY